MDAMSMLVMAAMATTVLVGAICRTAGLRSFRRTVMQGAPEAFGRMFRQSRLSPHDAAGRESDLVLAATRCASCRSADACRALLEAGQLRGARALCPNAAFLSGLESANARHAACVLRRIA